LDLSVKAIDAIPTDVSLDSDALYWQRSHTVCFLPVRTTKMRCSRGAWNRVGKQKQRVAQVGPIKQA